MSSMSTVTIAPPVKSEFGATTQAFREVTGDFSGSIGPVRTRGVSGASEIHAALDRVDYAPTSPQMWDCEVTLQPKSRGIPGMASFAAGDAITTSARLILSPSPEGIVRIEGISKDALHRARGDEFVTGSLTIRPVARLDETLTVTTLLTDSSVAIAACGMRMEGA